MMQRPPGRGARPNNKGLQRAMQYLGHYRRQAVLPYLFLIVATLSQLAVPRMVRNVIDAVVSGYGAAQVLTVLDEMPAKVEAQVIAETIKRGNLDLPDTASKAEVLAALNTLPTVAETVEMQLGAVQASVLSQTISNTVAALKLDLPPTASKEELLAVMKALPNGDIMAGQFETQLTTIQTYALSQAISGTVVALKLDLPTTASKEELLAAVNAMPSNTALFEEQLSTFQTLALTSTISNTVGALKLDLPTTASKEELVATLTTHRDTAPNTLLMAGVAIVGFALLRGVFAFLQAYWAEKNSQAVAFDLRNDLYAKIQRLSFSYHDRNRTGQLMVRATDDVEKVRLFIGQGLLQLLGALILIVATLTILFTTNVELAFATLPILPVAFVLFMIFGMISQPLFVKVQERLSALNTILQENLAGIKVIQAFTREKQEQAKFKTAADNLLDQQLRVTRIFTFLFPLIFLVANLGQASTLYFGGRQIIGGTLTLGEWQEFSLYLIYLFLPIAQFGIIISQMGQAAASATRVFEILDAKNDVTDKVGATTLPPVQGHVRFDHVTFRYYASGEPVLKAVSFDVLPGQTIALLGMTGSGKTSIINMLPRFYDVTEGRVLIDDHDVREVTLDSLRAQIGIVLQETTLFSGTLRDNIAFGKPDATQAEIEAAATAAAAHDFITSFAQGYDTPVGERGTTLSGGQKQRIAIARALLLNPRILILDDSTSSVDVQTEAVIQKALDRLMKGRTSFVIAQRISTVMSADQIVVLDKGAVAAIGKHQDLLEDSPIYAEIYRSQLVRDADEQDAAHAAAQSAMQLAVSQ